MRHTVTEGTYLASAGRTSSSSLSYGRAVHCTLRPVTFWESPMEPYSSPVFGVGQFWQAP